MEMDDFFRPLPIQLEALKHVGHGERLFYGGARGGGKRVSYDTKVLTDSGWKAAGDINLDDKLVAPDGNYTNIISIDKTLKGDMYEIEFEDSVTIKCDAEHNWLVYSGKHGSRDGWRIKTTAEINNLAGEWYIPLLDRPAPGNKWEGPDPYILGIILGDGTNSSHYTTVYSPDDYIIDYLKEHGWKCYHYDYHKTITMCQYFGEEYRNILKRHIGDQKQIPEDLLMADPATRLALLQGLMDTDGSCDKEGRCTFYSVSKYLIDAVTYLVRSLGGKANHIVVEKTTEYGGRGWYYKLMITHAGKFNPFRMPRKANRVRSKQTGIRNKIINIRKIEDCPAVCFAVNHPSHLFVIENFIVTHNSEFSLWVAILVSLQYPGIKVGVFRETFKELKDEIIRRFLQRYPEDIFGYDYKKADTIVEFDNGSAVYFRAIDSIETVKKIQGVEFQLMIIDEAPNFDPMVIHRMVGSLRNGPPGFTPSLIMTGNPGGRSSEYFKTRYIFPDYSKWDDYELAAKDKYVFIKSTVYDNTYIAKEYVDNLKSLPENLRKAWLEGDWNIFEGMFFTEWVHEKHVVATFTPPEHWRRIGGLDLGYSKDHPTVFLLAAQNPETFEIFIYKEYYNNGPIEMYISDIKNMIEDEPLEIIYADPSMWDEARKMHFSDESPARMFLREGIPLIQADNKRVNGWRVMKQWLSHTASREPLLRFMDCCPLCITTIPSLEYSKHSVQAEDCNTKMKDDAADAVRYLLVSGFVYPTYFERSDEYKKVREEEEERMEQYLNRGRNITPGAYYG